MTTPLAPVLPGASVVPAAPVAPAIPLNDVTGDAPVDRVVAPEPGTPSNINDAGRAFREKLVREALAAQTAPTDPAAPAVAVPAAEQPRNPDGTFAPKAGEAPAADAGAAPTDGTEPSVVADEPKVFVLKGESQRGEADIELDASTLPPEVVERLERAQKQGLRRAEYDTAMGKVRSLQSDLDAVETEIGMDPQGFVLNHVAPAHRPELAATLLFEHWDELAPLIQQYWNDETGRMRTQQQIRDGIASRKGTVQQQITQSRGVMQVRAAVQSLVPETADDATAQEFNQTALALLAGRNQVIAPDDVPKLLEAHVRRYFGAAPAPVPEPPARPKLAVRSTPIVAAPAAPAKAVASPAETARQIQARNAARTVAPQGAGPGAVQRPGPPANATVQEASKWWREHPR